jgi:hypothetical protein
MNILQKTTRKIISISFYAAVKINSILNDMKSYRELKFTYLNYPEETIGYQVSACLVKNNLDIIPNYENHDLKHIILGCGMTPEDEIRLQAFMFGNGNHSFPCIFLLVFGMILLPDMWSNFYHEYQKGKNSIPISSWNFEELALLNLKETQKKISQI